MIYPIQEKPPVKIKTQLKRLAEKRSFRTFLRTEAIVVVLFLILYSLLNRWIAPLLDVFLMVGLIIPIGGLLILQIFICALICKVKTVRRTTLLTLLVLPIAVFTIKVTHLDLRLNCALLAQQRINMISQAQQGMLKKTRYLEPPLEDVFVLPKEKEYLAHGGTRLYGKEGAFFYYSVGLLDGVSVSALVYLPSGIDGYRPPRGGKFVRLGQHWGYVSAAG